MISGAWLAAAREAIQRMVVPIDVVVHDGVLPLMLICRHVTCKLSDIVSVPVLQSTVRQWRRQLPCHHAHPYLDGS